MGSIVDTPRVDNTGPKARAAEAATRLRPLYARVSAGHVVFVTAGLLAAVLTFASLRAAKGMVSVAVARETIKAGDPVDERSFSLAEVNIGDEVLSSLLTADELDGVTGWVAVATIPAGELVGRSSLRAPSSDEGGDLRAMSIPVDRSHAAGGDLIPGDRVDVIGVRDGVARYVASHVEVLVVDDDGGGLTGGVEHSIAITLAVDAQTALRIASASAETRGIEVLRATGTTAVPEADAVFDPGAETNEAVAPS